MYIVKQEFHPGNEIRQVLYRVREPAIATADEPIISSSEEEADSGILPCGCLDESSQAEAEKPVFPLLDGSFKFGESSKPKRRRHFGITLNGKRKVERACGALDEMYKPDELVFLTGTIPGGGREVEMAIAEQAPFIVHRLKDWLSYYTGCPHEVWVWELQKRGMPHLHLVTACPDSEKRELLMCRFHREWCAILDEVCARSGVDVYRQGFGLRLRHQHKYVQAQAAQVKKSVARYMSKYLAKDTSHKRQCPILRWFGVSRPLNAAVRDRTMVVETAFRSYKEAQAIFRNFADDISPLCKVVFEYAHRVGDGVSLVAYPAGSALNRVIKENFPMSVSFEFLPQESRSILISSPAIRNMFEMQETLVSFSKFYTLSEAAKVAMRALPPDPETVLRQRTQGFRNWRKRLLIIAAEITPQRLSHHLSVYGFERYCCVLRALWDVEEEVMDHRAIAWQTVSIHSSAILRRIGERESLRRKSSDVVQENLVMANEVIEQLWLELPFYRKANGQFGV